MSSLNDGISNVKKFNIKSINHCEAINQLLKLLHGNRNKKKEKKRNKKG